MQIVEHTGIVREVIDAVNAAKADGLVTVKSIVLTRPEMDEFMEKQPFKGGVGKFYGDADVPSLMHVKVAKDQKSVTAFYLEGVLVEAPPESIK